MPLVDLQVCLFIFMHVRILQWKGCQFNNFLVTSCTVWCCVDILTQIQSFTFNEIHKKTSSAKYQPFCAGLNRLTKYRPALQWRHMSVMASQITGNTNVSQQYVQANSKHKSKIKQKKPTTWWRHQMETFSALLAICAGNSSVSGEFPAQRPVTRSFDVFFDLRLNKRLSKQWWGWWFETLSGPLWHHCNEIQKHQSYTSLSLCNGNPPVTGGFPHKGPVMWKTLPYHDVFMAQIGEKSYKWLDNQRCLFEGSSRKYNSFYEVITVVRDMTHVVSRSGIFLGGTSPR